MRKTLLTLSLLLTFTISTFASEPICKDGTIWTNKYGCEPPPCIGCGIAAPTTEGSWFDTIVVAGSDFIAFIVP